MENKRIMNKGIILIALILVSCNNRHINKIKSEISEVDVAIENVQLFDSLTKDVIGNKTILIKGNIIAGIIDEAQNFQAKKIIDGKQRLVIPGFIDTHMHLTQIFCDGNEKEPGYISNNDSYRQALARQYLNYGVTTILDLGQPEKWLAVSMQWQKEASAEYPNQFNAGGALISDYEWKPNMNHSEILSPNHAIDKIKEYSNKGIKHIKLYSFLNEKDLINVLDAAKKQKITAFGHLDRGEVNIPKAIELGVKNFEHFFTLVNGVLTTSAHWIEFNNKYNLGRIRTVDEWTAAKTLYFDYIDSKPELNKRLNALMDTMAVHEVNISTTISVFASVAGHTEFFSSFQNFPLRSSAYFPSYTNIDKSELRKAFKTMMRNLKKAHDKGIKIRIGTDCRHGGQALLSELILLGEAGFAVDDILQIATLNGAKAMRIDDQYGSIKKGKIADLIIFDKNPFEDYKNFLSQKIIIKNGKIFKPKKDLTNDMLKVVTNAGIDKAFEWYDKIKESEDYYPFHEIQLNEVGYELLKINNVAAAIRIFKFSITNFEDAGNKYNSLDEEQLNSIGYHLLELENTSGAIEIFKFNSELFPDSWNVYDSLGEVYLLVGNIQLAKDNYKKSLRINPDNNFAIDALEKMKKE